MKNLKVGKKFLLAFGLILIMFVIAVISAGVGIRRSKASYRRFYEQEYEAITSVYQMQISLQEGLKELLLAVVESDQDETNRMVQKVNEDLQSVQTQLQSIYEIYSGDVSLLKNFETMMVNNKPVREKAIEAASRGTKEGNEEAQQIILREYNPVVEQYVEVLRQAFQKMEQESHDQYEESMKMLDYLYIASVLISVAAFILTCLIALRLTKLILVPVQKLEEVMKEVVKGNLSADVEYDSKDEFGEMATYMHEMTTGVAAIIKDIERILTAMAGGDFSARSADRSSYIGDYKKILQAMIGIKAALNTTMTTLNQSADQVASGSDQVSSGAQALSQGATEQASSVEELAASINDISNRINENAHGAETASKKSDMVSEIAGREPQDAGYAVSHGGYQQLFRRDRQDYQDHRRYCLPDQYPGSQRGGGGCQGRQRRQRVCGGCR